jgi:predicted NBD/HSP70 family sugar kinase
MADGIGIFITERIAAAVITDNRISGPVRSNAENGGASDSLHGIPAEIIVKMMVEQVRQLQMKEAPVCVGVGLPGIVRNGTVEDSPNYIQFKGMNMQTMVAEAITSLFGEVPVSIYNDADVMAAGIAATRGHLDKLTRAWTLGTGIGYGRYPFNEGVWEAGHSVVSLDPKEQYCGCGGKGHLEGIMGHRSMRLRFMDLEPEEVFEQAQVGEARCVDFVKLWHRALAAATATSIHLDGPGKFFITGPNSRFLNLTLLGEYLHEMVKLSPLQGYSTEIVPGGENVALIGAVVNASQALERATC